MGEYQLAPGIYISNIEKQTIDQFSFAKTADQYIEELISKGMLNEQILAAELERLTLSQEKLEESNAILQEEEDEECQLAYRENLDVMVRQNEKIEKITKLLQSKHCNKALEVQREPQEIQNQDSVPDDQVSEQQEEENDTGIYL